MSNERKSKSLLICCVFLFLAGFVNTSACKGQTSVLSRVKTIDDPELGELIRVALENLPEPEESQIYSFSSPEYKKAQEAHKVSKLHTVRLVTEAYTQIKLLDSQIEQSNAKLGTSGQPDALAREFILAKTELESQRATKLAELREIMHIIPRHALGRKPVKDLKGWLRLDIIGDSVLVFICAKPFTENEYRVRHTFVKLMSSKEAMKYALDYISKDDHLPVRVDIFRNVDGVKFSEELEKELIRNVKRAELELEAEVHLSEDVHVSHEGHAYGLLGKLGLSYGRKSVAIGPERRRELITELRNPMDAEEFDKYIRGKLVGGPERLPVKFSIKYDEQSRDLALQAAGTVRDIAKKLGVDKLVEVTHEQWDPDEKR